MQPVEVLLSSNAFGAPLYVEGREAIANMFAKTKRCGIYVLHFGDGMHYVGQTTDVTRRYVEHRRNYNDIIRISFKQVISVQLNHEERRIRNLLQDNGHTLRGVVGVYPLPGEADLDLVMPEMAQRIWVEDISSIDYSGSRTKNPALRKTFEGKFTRLAKKPYFCDAVEILRKYVRIGIPRIRATEETFWSCSCLPYTYTYTRININWQEVFAIHQEEDDLSFSFQIALSPLKGYPLIKNYFERFPEVPFNVAFNDDEVWLSSSYNEHQSIINEACDTGVLDMDDETCAAFNYYIKDAADLHISSYRYVPGGDDQVRFWIKGKDRVSAFLDDETIVASIRKFNLRLMRLGPSHFKTSHCLPLADLIVEE